MKLWRILNTNPVEIRNGQPRDGSSLGALRDNMYQAHKLFSEIKPQRNINELAHIGLMVDIRLYYVDLKILEAKYNSESFSRDDIPDLLTETESLRKTAQQIDKRFTELNKGYLKPSEVDEQNRIRNQRLNILYYRLKQQK
jgi:hypothetical protein